MGLFYIFVSHAQDTWPENLTEGSRIPTYVLDPNEVTRNMASCKWVTELHSFTNFFSPSFGHAALSTLQHLCMTALRNLRCFRIVTSSDQILLCFYPYKYGE